MLKQVSICPFGPAATPKPVLRIFPELSGCQMSGSRRTLRVSSPDGVDVAPRASLTPGRSIAVDNALHVYGTSHEFIQADLPLTDEKRRMTLTG